MVRVEGWITCAVVLVVLDTIMYALLQKQGPALAAEHGLIENLQAAALAATTVFYVWKAGRAKRERSFLFLCAALLCFTMFVREFDVRKLDVPHLVLVLGSGRLKDLIFMALWGITGWIAVGRLHPLARLVRENLTISLLLPFAVAGGFLVLGDMVEKHLIPATPRVFYEELFELNGYLILAAASSITRLFTRRPSPGSRFSYDAFATKALRHAPHRVRVP